MIRLKCHWRHLDQVGVLRKKTASHRLQEIIGIIVILQNHVVVFHQGHRQDLPQNKSQGRTALIERKNMNPKLANDPFINLSFFGGFRSYKIEILSKNGLMSPRLPFGLVKPQKEDVIKSQLEDLRNWLIKRQSCHHTKTSQLIWRANELASFHMMETLAFNELMNITGVYTERKVYRNKVVSYRYVKEREYSI